jgi:hypothetical protein
MSSAPSIRLVLLASLFVGCAQISKETAYVPAPPLPSFHAQIPEPVNQIRRVAVLPIAYQTPLEASLAGLDSALREELAKTSLFELVPISRQELDSRFNQRQFSSVEIVPAELLTTLRTEYGVDGVLFTELTSYRPYQPIAIGLRSSFRCRQPRDREGGRGLLSGNQPAPGSDRARLLYRSGGPAKPFTVYQVCRLGSISQPSRQSCLR